MPEINPAALSAIHVAGSHTEVGAAIGHAFAAQIHAMYNSYAFLQETLLPYFATAEGRDHYDALLTVNRAAFPGYVAELAGMAQGAGRPFHELFLCNVRGEIYSAVGIDLQGCFDCALITKDAALLGHNEDGAPGAKTTAYLVHAQVDGEPGWTAYSYPGFLCGNAFGFNRRGIVLTIDNVISRRVGIGLGRHFLARSVLAAPDLDDAVKRVTRPGQGAGFNYIIGHVGQRRILAVESAPDCHHIHEVSGVYHHANHYCHLPDHPQDVRPSSHLRMERAAELPTPTNRQEILALLGDRSRADYPIFRTATPPDGAATLCTALFDLDAATLSIYLDHPTDRPEARIVLPIA